MVIGGLGYLLDVVILILLPDSTFAFSQFTFIGELLLPLWLVIKGVNSDQWSMRNQND